MSSVSFMDAVGTCDSWVRDQGLYFLAWQAAWHQHVDTGSSGSQVPQVMLWAQKGTCIGIK